MRKIQFRSSFNAFLHYQLLTRPDICLESMFAHLKMDFYVQRMIFISCWSSKYASNCGCVILKARSANFLKSDSKDLSAEEASLKMKEYLVYHHNYKLKL